MDNFDIVLGGGYCHAGIVTEKSRKGFKGRSF